MTLKQIINCRGHKYDEDILNHVSMADYSAGYQMGWKEAYRDIKEILEQNGFNMNQIVIKEKERVR